MNLLSLVSFLYLIVNFSSALRCQYVSLTSVRLAGWPASPVACAPFLLQLVRPKSTPNCCASQRKPLNCGNGEFWWKIIARMTKSFTFLSRIYIICWNYTQEVSTDFLPSTPLWMPCMPSPQNLIVYERSVDAEHALLMDMFLSFSLSQMATCHACNKTSRYKGVNRDFIATFAKTHNTPGSAGKHKTPQSTSRSSMNAHKTPGKDRAPAHTPR